MRTKIWLIVNLSFIGFCANGLAQPSLADVKAPILAAKELYFKNSDRHIDTVTDYNGYPEFWSIDNLDSHTHSFRIMWYQQEHLYTEIYLLDEGNLIYALEEIKDMPFNHRLQSRWRCEYFIQDDLVIDYTSLGMGKTEDDTWDPESVLVQFRKRQAELEKIRK